MTTLRVVRGNPDDDELAALVAALAIVAERRVDSVAARRFEGTGSPGLSRWRAALRNGPLPKDDGAWRRAHR